VRLTPPSYCPRTPPPVPRSQPALSLPAPGGPRTPLPLPSLPPGASRIVNAIRGLFRARTMQEYCDVLPVLARDVVWGESCVPRRPGGHLPARRLGAPLLAIDYPARALAARRVWPSCS
jgi:hypothetical protein